mgnify:CR=1 FL=1
MILIGDLIIRCSSCGTEYTIDTDSLDEDVSYIGEGSMGEQYQHTYEGQIDCECCGKSMIFRLLGFEYPVGAKEYQESEANGCEIMEEPYMEMEYDFDIPDEYESWIADNVADLIEQIKRDRSVIYRISDRQFEELVAEVFQRNGYTVELTPAIKDGGKDVIATRNINGVSICLYIECKHYDPSDPVGVGIVRYAAGVRSHDRVNKAIVVTTSRFTRGASKFAAEEKHLIQLMGLDDLMRMM